MEINKCKKLVCNLFNKKKYVSHINTLKQALNHGLKLKKNHRIIEFNQEAWLKPYINMNTDGSGLLVIEVFSIKNNGYIEATI